MVLFKRARSWIVLVYVRPLPTSTFWELWKLLPVPGVTSKYIIDIFSDPPEGLESEGIFIKSECLQNGWSIGWILMQDYSCLSTIYYSALFIHMYVIYIHTHRHIETHQSISFHFIYSRPYAHMKYVTFPQKLLLHATPLSGLRSISWANDGPPLITNHTKYGEIPDTNVPAPEFLWRQCVFSIWGKYFINHTHTASKITVRIYMAHNAININEEKHIFLHRYMHLYLVRM